MTAALPFIAAGISLVGGVMGAMGAQQSSRAQVAAADFNAQEMERQALVAERNKQIALDQAELAARDQRAKNRATNGSIRAAYGASGFGMEGSPLDVLQATAIEEELDVDKILYKGDLQGLEWTEKGTSYRQQAQLYRMGGQAAATAGSYGVATSLLAGLGGAVKSFTPSAGFPTAAAVGSA